MERCIDLSIEKLFNSKGFALDVETTSISGKKRDNLHFKKCTIRCVGFYSKETGAFALSKEEINPVQMRQLMESDVKKIGHNIKFDAKVISEAFKCHVKAIYLDSSIEAKLLDENENHDLDSLSRRYIDDSKQGSYDEEDIEKLKAYCAHDAELSYKLAELFYGKLKEQKLLPLLEIEMGVVRKMCEAELKGVNVDVKCLEKLSRKYTRNVERITSKIYKVIGHEFNINSPKQLTDILYIEQKMPVLRQTLKQSASTDTKTMSLLSSKGHRIADWILLYRHWEMLVRHIDKLIKEQIDGQLYCTFNTLGTETGRFSCSNPNLQQIPSKTKESLAIRKAFTGNIIVGDYSNVELRLLAHYSKDPRLLSIYGPGGHGDLHKVTSESLGIDRGRAKTINFGISYGIGSKNLGEQLGVSKEQAQDYIDKWYATYKGVQPCKDMIIATCKKYGYVSTIGGRRRHIRFQGLDRYGTYAAERECVNSVIQGSSADITKMAIVDMMDEDVRLQVHDELCVYNPKRPLAELGGIMEGVLKKRGIFFRVPLIVDYKAVKSWGSMKD
jgi:DNA polymerase-1